MTDSKDKKPKGIIRMDQTRINYYKSLISFDKKDFMFLTISLNMVQLIW